MQTFLPYADFTKSAKVLDYRRLGKQRVECLQILNTLHGKSKGKGWRNHPAVKMWKGHEQALVLYGIAVCLEWKKRGYKDNVCFKKICSYLNNSEKHDMPVWVGNIKFHQSHRSNLVRKKAEHYRKYFKNVPDDLPYIWPV